MYVYVCPSRSKNSEAIFYRAKHAVPFQIKYIIQKKYISTSWAPKHSVSREILMLYLEFVGVGVVCSRLGLGFKHLDVADCSLMGGRFPPGVYYHLS